MKIRISILELIVVVVIVTVLSTILYSSVYSGCYSSPENIRQANLRILNSLLNMYATEHEGHYPREDKLESFMD